MEFNSFNQVRLFYANSFHILKLLQPDVMLMMFSVLFQMQKKRNSSHLFELSEDRRNWAESEYATFESLYTWRNRKRIIIIRLKEVYHTATEHLNYTYEIIKIQQSSMNFGIFFSLSELSRLNSACSPLRSLWLAQKS